MGPWKVMALLKAIDKGKHAGGRTGHALRSFSFYLNFHRVLFSLSFLLIFLCVGFWLLDPIDGTKGFLHGRQYAVCLALLVDTRVELGIIGSPNLPTEPSPFPQNSTATDGNDDDGEQQQGAQDRGALFIAVRGQGTYQLPLYPPTPTSGAHRRRLTMPHLSLHELSFLESYEKAHAALDTNALVRGDGGGVVYLPLPATFGENGAGDGDEEDDDGSGYQEKLWVRLSRALIAFATVEPLVMNDPYVFPLTPLDRSLPKRPVASSPIIVAVRSTLASDARSIRILVLLRRVGRCMRR